MAATATPAAAAAVGVTRSRVAAAAVAASAATAGWMTAAECLSADALRRPVRRVLIVVAMEQEVQPLVEHFGLPRLAHPFLAGSPMVAWGGTLPDRQLELHIVWCGMDARYGNNNVGTAAAAVSTYASCAAFGAPDLVLSVGTAGGFSAHGAQIGDVFLSTKCVFHSRRIPGASGDGELEESGFGHYRSPPLLGLARAAGLKLGVVSTSDSLDATPLDLQLMAGEGASVKEMEAAAVAWTCQQLGVPFVALKGITDLVDGAHATRGEFESNLATAAASLQAKLAAVLRLLEGEPLSRWSE